MRIDAVAASWEAESPEYRAHIADLSAALADRGHDVKLHIRRDSPEPPDFERTRQGFDLVRVLAGPAEPLSSAALLPHLDEFASVLDRTWAEHVPDVVHLHSWQSGLAVRESPAPMVQSFNGLKLADGGRRAELERLVALSADHVLAASADEVALAGRLGVPRTRVSLVPWGVDADRFRVDGPIAPRGTEPRVIVLGDVEPRGEIDTAIDALAAVPRAELLVVGAIRSRVPREDPEFARLVRRARDLGVDQRVRFTGQVGRAELPALLRSADVVVRVPREEPSGIRAIQAMACGVPVVASAVGALTDIVLDDLTGVLVPARDPVALGRAVRELLASPVRREVCSITGGERARSRYSWARVADEVVGAYDRTARTPRNSRGRTAARR
ncbi:MAG TPA: glycosyltransferase [Umezawaea sp.]|nr:glycosyltransferase [Umezawaea sp.]